MLISGKTIANFILERSTQRIKKLWDTRKIQPHLIVIQVGSNPASSSYIAQKKKTAEKIGAELSLYKMADDVSQEELLQTIDFLQHNSEEPIHGLLVQLPLPQHLDRDVILAAIDADKDVDGFGEVSPYRVPLATAIFYFLATIWQIETQEQREQDLFPLDPRIKNWLHQKRILVIGRGFTAGKPISEALEKEGFTIDSIHLPTENPTEHISQADIIISCAGQQNVVKKEYVKKDTILLGVGISRDSEGNPHLDYEITQIEGTAKYFTPIIGGVGPVNVACLMDNLVTAAENS